MDIDDWLLFVIWVLVINNNMSSIGFEVRERGVVKSVRECILTIDGLPSGLNGQIIELKQGGRGMVTGFKEHEVPGPGP